MPALQLNTACEGPLALNDHAFELCREFVQPEGVRFFQQVSRYDVYLAEVLKKPEYQAGDTLKLILPFLKAHGLTNARIGEYSRKSIMPVPGVEAAYKFLHTQGFPIFEISLSYRQFAEAVGQRLGFDAAHIFCTELDLDRYSLPPAEKEELLRLQQEIVAAPEIELPPAAASPEDLPPQVQDAIKVYARIFWERVPEMEIGAIYQEVNPLGGPDKALALEESLARTGLKMSDVIYVGDGSTDVQAFAAVRAGGGLSISFNGNGEAVKAAEVSIIADNAWPIALMASVFLLWGKEGVMELATKGTAAASRYLVLPEAVIDILMRGLQGRNFNLYAPSNRDPEEIAKESTAMRARLRGAAVAAQGVN
jgi:predicted HAD superfamily phosphohydrolase